MARLTFVGTGEAFDPDLPNTSLLYEGTASVLFDCGFSIPHAFWRLRRDPSLLDAVYITHRHADHAFGLPALLLWMREAGRTRPLDVIGGPGVGPWLTRLLGLGYPGSFSRDRGYPIVAVELAPGHQMEVGGVVLRSAESQHSVVNLSVRLDAEHHSVCYSGDGRPTAATRALYRGARILVHECYSLLPTQDNHADLDTLLSMTEELQPGELYLLHLGREAKRAIGHQAPGSVGSTRLRLPAPGYSVELD